MLQLRLGHGIRVGRKHLARLMRHAGLVGVHRRSTRPATTLRDAAAKPAPDLVDRHFTVAALNQLWVADITYLPTAAGFLYLGVVLDACSRRVIGWSIQSRLHTQLVCDALDTAVRRRRPSPGTIHHSDQGCQYTSIAFGLRLRQAGLAASMGSVGDCYDNALCESFFATLETELIDRSKWAGHNEARLAVFDYIEGFYNPKRRHSSLGNYCPIEYERRYHPLTDPA